MIQGLPEKIQQQRIRLGITQRQLAQRLGVSPSIVSGYETGERTPSTEILLALSYLFGCSTDFLLGRKAAEPPEAIPVEGLNDRQVQALRCLIEAIRE